MNSNSKSIFIGTIIGVSLGLLAFRGFTSYQKYQLEQRENRFELAWYRHMLVTKQGYIAGIGNYHLASFDCGRTFYNVETTDDKPIGNSNDGFISQFGYKIISPADTKVLSQIEGMEMLVKFAQKNGKLDPSTKFGKELLEGAGFQIKEVAPK